MQAGPSETVRHGGGCRTKNLQEERKKRKRREERKREERRKKERGAERKERETEESKRERCIMDVKYPPWNCQKIIKDMEIEEEAGAEKKKSWERRKRQKRSELRCENRICILFKY